MKLRPVFEHLRQMKAKRKQKFSANLKTLTGTLETRSESAKQALKKDCLTLSNVIMIGTRKSGLNTEIEPRNESSKKLNVDGGTCLARSRLTGLRLTPAMALPFCRQASALSSLALNPIQAVRALPTNSIKK